MLQVTCCYEFETLAKQLDYLEDLNDWKQVKESEWYDYERIDLRLKLMRQLRKQGNLKTLVHCLRQDLVKNQAGISDPQLYNQCHFGTKRLIEKYHNEVIKCIRQIYSAKTAKLTLQQKLTFFSETRHSFGHTALMLSGGATFGKFHFGLMKALHEHDLFPRTVCGSSIGSLTAATICARPFEDLKNIFDPELIFKKPILGWVSPNWWQTISCHLQGKPILDQKVIREYAQHMIGEYTFSDIHSKFGWNLNITVTDFSNADGARLLNYLTAPNVLVWSACVASCAIPGMYPSADLLMRTESGQNVPYNPQSSNLRFQDGSVGGDLPMQRLTELFNINTFIVSQCNPHVVPFLSLESSEVGDSYHSQKYVRTLKRIIGNEIKHWMKQLNELGLLSSTPRWIASVVQASYKGDVTIAPSPSLADYRNLLVNVTPERFNPACQQMYVKTLKKIAFIRSVYGIEREFDRYYNRLKAQLRGGDQNLDLYDSDAVEFLTKRQDQSTVWDSPDPSVSLAKSHLQTNPDYPFEALQVTQKRLICYLTPTASQFSSRKLQAMFSNAKARLWMNNTEEPTYSEDGDPELLSAQGELLKLQNSLTQHFNEQDVAAYARLVEGSSNVLPIELK